VLVYLLRTRFLVSEGRFWFAPKLFSCGPFEKTQTGLIPVKKHANQGLPVHRFCAFGPLYLFFPSFSPPANRPTRVILASSISYSHYSSVTLELTDFRGGSQMPKEKRAKKLRQRVFRL
jgi:hypothetical protein